MKNWLSFVVAMSAVFALAFFDAWRLVGLPRGTSLAIAVIPALVIAVAFLVAAHVGRKTGRRLLMQLAAASVAAAGVITYARHVLIGPGDPGGASQMHVIFFPLGLALFAALVIAACAIIARAWPRLPASEPDR